LDAASLSVQGVGTQGDGIPDLNCCLLLLHHNKQCEKRQALTSGDERDEMETLRLLMRECKSPSM